MAQSVRSCSVGRLVEVLAEQVRQIEGARRPAWGDAISSGFAGLDRLLPGGGLKRGSLVEWLGSVSGAGRTGRVAGAGETGRVSGAGGSFGDGGAGTLALCAAREAAAAGGAVVVIDRSRRFYPPAAVSLGLELGRLVVVRPQSDEDEAWAIDQSLRSLGVSAVWCAPREPDGHALRRWQLAAETSGVLGLIIRGDAAREEPSWAEARLAVAPLVSAGGQRRRRLRVELLRARGRQSGGTVELELGEVEIGAGEEAEQQAWPVESQETKHETSAVRLASQLAAAKTGRRSRRA